MSLTHRQKVVVAMSGGVDSSVAACLLAEQDHEVIGLFMRVGAEAVAEDADSPPGTDPSGPPGHHDAEAGAACLSGPDSPDSRSRLEAGNHAGQAGGGGARSHQGCCSASDAADARFVAGKLGIPFYALNFAADFDAIIEYFADEYGRGRTPNPCVVCNDRLKFGKLLDYADAVGAACVATGHYARVAERGGRPMLLRGVDERKDQSYVLFGLSRGVLDRVRFPLGRMTKGQVRDEALRRGLPVHDKPDSVEICFVPDRDYARVVRGRRPEAFVPGDVVDADGRVLGRHDGLPNYTIGQRRGLGIAAGEPIYVTELDTETRTVTVGRRQALLRRSLLADRVNLLADPPAGPFRAQAKIRYLHRAADATVTLLDGGRMRVDFDGPQTAITPGQACVLYDGDVVLGGGWISAAIDGP